ncbi:HNHc domain-containing protein [Trichophyton interdigitale]|nr:HNHc domain-containing protein [Trichophyton interdigitale]KAG5218609.1 HNHc domain-containing protein [Trichophyton interdigitale]KAG8207150.1 HNHc domain-containing protein [Trichophyton interdigitale]
MDTTQGVHILEEEFFSDARVELLRELDGLFNEQPVSRELWAFLWLADLDKLKQLIVKARDDAIDQYVILDWLTSKGQIVKQWTQKSRQSSAASSPALAQSRRSSPSSLDPRGVKRKLGEITSSSDEAEKCRERDSQKCIITGAGMPIEVAHIFPFSMRYLQSPEASNDIYSPWRVLRRFWTDDKVDEWFRAIQPTTETMRNMLCLAPSVHKYHGEAYFALKPVELSEDRTQLKLRFYWLPRVDNPSAMRVSAKPDIPAIKDRRWVGERGAQVLDKIKLYNVDTDLRIFSGDLIVIKTANADTHPLPDTALLQMQWVLHAVTALAGGAEPLDLDDNSDGESPDMAMDFLC